jgi:hypothetical protein
MSSRAQTQELLEALSDSAVALLEAVAVPAYIVDNDLRVRWQNAASRELVGDLRGRLELSSKVVPEDLDLARDAFTQKQNGAEHTEVELSVLRRTAHQAGRGRVGAASDLRGRSAASALFRCSAKAEPSSDAPRPARASVRLAPLARLLVIETSSGWRSRRRRPQPCQARAAQPRRQLPRGGRREGSPRRARLTRFGR